VNAISGLFTQEQFISSVLGLQNPLRSVAGTTEKK